VTLGPPIVGTLKTGGSELAAGLSKRKGKSLTTTAMTILMSSPQNDPNRATTISESLRVLMTQFPTLYTYDQEYLLRMYWDDLGEVFPAPALKRMLGDNPTASKNVHDAALRRLIEIAPDEARPFVVREICNPASLVDVEIICKLANQSLPEVDRCLLERLKLLAASGHVRYRIFLDHAAALAVRFATENIYQDIMRIYRVKVQSCMLRHAQRCWHIWQNKTKAMQFLLLNRLC